MSVQRWDLKICGCDDSTFLPGLELDPAAVAALQRITALAKATADYACMPTLEFTPTPTAPPDGALCEKCWEPFAPGVECVRDRRGDWVHAHCREVAA